MTPMGASKFRRRLRAVAMLALSLAIIGYLVYRLRNEQAFQQFQNQPKQWEQFFFGGVLSTMGLSISIVRWYYLVRALHLPFRVLDAFRLGMLGNLLNFVSLGNVGGDLFKAIFIAREQPGRRAEAVATVFVDRAIGLYGLFVVASCCIVATRLWNSPVAEVKMVTQATLVCTVIGGLGLVAILIPGFTQGALSEMVAGLPKVGPTVEKLILAVRMYSRRLPVLLWSIVASVVVHSLIAAAVYMCAKGLPGPSPTLSEHLVIVPLANVAGAVPIVPMGLGPFEGTVEFLYDVLAEQDIPKGKGFLTAIGYRVVTLIMACLGIVFWIGNRRQVAETMHAMEEES